MDQATWPVTVVPGNQSGGADYAPQGVVTLRDGHFEIRANLVVNSGQLRIKNALVDVVGNIRLGNLGQILVEDATLHVKCSREREFEWFINGGHLRTERARVGGNKSGYQMLHTDFWLNRGVWEAIDTTIEYAAGILMGLPWGYGGDPLLTGGTLKALRLSQGEGPDWIHLIGCGDVTLVDSTFAIAPSIRAHPTQPATVRFDCNVRTPVTAVYGDPAVHQGVNRAMPGSLWRLELRNTRVPDWGMHFDDVQSTNAPLQVILDNAESISCGIAGYNVVGQPSLAGDWSRYGGELPGLPSTLAPGWHVMPAGASMSLASLTVTAGNTDAHVSQWAFYLSGSATNVTVTGPSNIAEIVMYDGRLTLAGGKDFGMGLVASVIELHEGSLLDASDAMIGGSGQNSGIYPMITAFGRARCNLNRVRANNLTLTTMPENGSAAAAITANDAYLSGTLNTYPYPPGSINVVRATPDRNVDLQNLDFDGGLQPGGVPNYWSGFGVNGSAGTARPTCETNLRSYRFQTSGTLGGIWKSLSLPEGTTVQAFGFGNVQSAQAGQLLSLSVGGPGGVWRSATLNNAPGWQLLQVPPFTVGTAPGTIDVWFANASAGNSDVLLDGFRVHIANWWECDNLLNLDFENPRYRLEGRYPTFWRAPDYWELYRGEAQPTTTELRPGTSGQRAARITLRDGATIALNKDLSFLASGDRITLTGWLKCTPVAGTTADMAVLMGEGTRYNDSSYGNNARVQVPADNAWHPVTLNYTVPCPPARLGFTRLSVHCFGAPGTVVVADDFAVTIR